MDLTGCRWVYAIVFISTSMVVYQVSAIKDYELSFNCDTEISMIRQQIYQGRFLISSNLFSSDKSTCDVAVESWYSLARMMFYFETFNLTCEQGQLEFFDGIGSNASRVKGLENPLCGNNRPDGTYVTDNMELNIRFTENTKPFTGQNIVVAIIITAFMNKPCEGYHYVCDNDRCIIDDLNCSGFNPCGDNSDCRPTGLGPWEWLGIIVGCLVGVVCGVIGVVALVCFCKYFETSKIRFTPRPRQPREENYNVTSDATFSQEQPFIPGQQHTSPINNSNH